MPSHNPSPHRFLAARPSTSKPKPKPQSGLRNAQTPSSTFTATQTHAPVIGTPRPTPAKRFVIAPTQTRTPGSARPKEPENELREDTNTQVTPRAQPRRSLKRVESIETDSQSSQPAFQQDGSISAPVAEQTQVNSDDEQERDDDDDTEILFTSRTRHKRRRISPEPPATPAHRATQPPQTPAPTAASTSHRFLVPAPRTPAPFPHASPTTQSAVPTASSRPHFLLPAQPPSPVKPSTPLPETFSPSRKGQKFMPGGLASTLQSWIIETASTGYAAQSRDAVVWGREREDGVKVRVRVSEVRSGKVGAREGGSGEGEECYSDGVLFVRGETDAALYNASRLPGEEVVDVRVILAAQGGVRGGGGVSVKRGNVVGMRAPIWDVEMDGEKWAVAVDWVVLV